MSIFSPRLGDVVDRMTILLLKLEHTLGDPRRSNEAQRLQVERWLDELRQCLRASVAEELWSVALFAELYDLNRQIWKAEDTLSVVTPTTTWEPIGRLALQVRAWNRQRALTVACLNGGASDKVTKDRSP